MEELVRSAASAKRNEVQERINEQLDAFNPSNTNGSEEGRVRDRNPSRYRGAYRAARPELIDLVRQEGRTNDWYDEVQDTPFVDEITAVNTPAGFSTPKFSLYDGIADPGDHIIHFK
ncbi:hypothetical protein FNV43_RR05391 [Rhamnella rubrinervis]|uniref:Uncharacterized protein n=1 Tax=Rhamnella rubrinervis TaxID=2594499 RepID=A0A8K0MR69_9ROSA|nr:hypothetical protein FNV43_RR05391 [Rhamnella rubrinervis]